MNDFLNLSDELHIYQADDCEFRMFFYNEIYKHDFREAKVCFIKNVFIISDPPYNQDYRYGAYKDNLAINEYINLLKAAFRTMRAVIIHYPEPTINLLPAATESYCSESVSWVYNNNTGKQSRQITWWNCNLISGRLDSLIKILMINALSITARTGMN